MLNTEKYLLRLEYEYCKHEYETVARHTDDFEEFFDAAARLVVAATVIMKVIDAPEEEIIRGTPLENKTPEARRRVERLAFASAVPGRSYPSPKDLLTDLFSGEIEFVSPRARKTNRHAC